MSVIKDEDFPHNATGDAVTGDHLLWKEGVFGGSFKKPSYLGDRRISGKVIRDAYGQDKQQHTFTLEVTGSDGLEPIETGTTIRRKGRNIYRNGTQRASWDDEADRKKALDEKHGRGDLARAIREQRKEEEPL